MIETILSHLSKLVALDTTSSRSNLEMIAYLESTLTSLGFSIERVWDDDRRKAGIIATTGPSDRPGTVLSAHTDTVPVDNQVWSSDPFQLRREAGRVYGRGTADMKGFIAVCLALAGETSSASLNAPIHLAFSYDEELGCLGAPRLVERLRDSFGPQLGVIVGEPTGMELVLGHKGNTVIEIVTRGRAAHSSLAPTTVSAIDLMNTVQNHLHHVRDVLAGAACDAAYDVPFSTVCATRISGGTAINIVPEERRMNVEFRTLPEVDIEEVLVEMSATLSSFAISARRLEPESDIEINRIFSYPGLGEVPDEAFCSTVARAIKSNNPRKVAYGTEAGIFNRILGCPTVVVGPGSIEQAHRPDEYVELGQLDLCLSALTSLLLENASDREPTLLSV